jgi:hypothetical protein
VTPSALYITALAFPWLALSIHSLVLGNRRLLLSACIGAVGTYVLLLWYVHALDAEIAATLSSFDLNHDGGFSGNELTPAYEDAMAAYSNDTGRGIAPITGAVFALVYGALALGAWLLCANILQRMRRNRI